MQGKLRHPPLSRVRERGEGRGCLFHLSLFQPLPPPPTPLPRTREGRTDRKLYAYHSIPFCARTPAVNACFTNAISVTVSADSINASGAPRPVTTTCCCAGLALRSASTTARSR